MAKLTKSELQRRGAFTAGEKTKTNQVKTSSRATAAVKQLGGKGVSAEEIQAALIRKQGGKDTGTSSSLGELERGKAKIEKGKAKEKEEESKKESTSKLDSFEASCSEFGITEIAEIPSNYNRLATRAADDLSGRSTSVGQEMEIFKTQVEGMRNQGLTYPKAMQVVKDVFMGL